MKVFKWKDLLQNPSRKSEIFYTFFPVIWFLLLLLLGLQFSVFDYEVAGTILGTSTILNVDKVWNGVHTASWGQFGSYLIEK